MAPSESSFLVIASANTCTSNLVALWGTWDQKNNAQVAIRYVFKFIGKKSVVPELDNYHSLRQAI